MLKPKSRKGEIGTIVMMALLVFVSVFTLASSSFVNKQKNLASNPRAQLPCEINQSHCVQECGSISSCSSSCAKQYNVPDEGTADRICTGTASPTPRPPTNTPAPVQVTRYGSMNCTPEQICGNYANYVPGSQYQEGSVRVVTCKDKNIPASPASCDVGDVIPPSITPDPQPPACTSGAYTELIGCENICGIGNCQSCKLGSATKYECKDGASVPQCTASMTYATIINCQSASCSDCRQCHLAGDTAVRYECGGAGPTIVPIATPTSSVSSPSPTKKPTPTSTPKPMNCKYYSTGICSNNPNKTFSYYQLVSTDCTGQGLNIPCYGTASNNCNSYTWGQILNYKCFNVALPTATPTLASGAPSPTKTPIPTRTPIPTSTPKPLPTLKPSNDCTNLECRDPHKTIWYSYNCTGVPQTIQGQVQCPKFTFYGGKDCNWLYKFFDLNSIQEMEDNYCSNDFPGYKRKITINYNFSLTKAIDISPDDPYVDVSIYNGSNSAIALTLESNPSIPKIDIRNFPQSGINGITTVVSSTNVICIAMHYVRTPTSSRYLSSCGDVENGVVNISMNISNAK